MEEKKGFDLQQAYALPCLFLPDGNSQHMDFCLQKSQNIDFLLAKMHCTFFDMKSQNTQ